MTGRTAADFEELFPDRLTVYFNNGTEAVLRAPTTALILAETQALQGEDAPDAAASAGLVARLFAACLEVEGDAGISMELADRMLQRIRPESSAQMFAFFGLKNEDAKPGSGVDTTPL